MTTTPIRLASRLADDEPDPPPAAEPRDHPEPSATKPARTPRRKEPWRRTQQTKNPWTRGQKIAVVGIAIIGAVVGGGGLALAFESVAQWASPGFHPYGWAVPLVIDLMIGFASAAHLLYLSRRKPAGWLRLVELGFIGLTVRINVEAAPDDDLGLQLAHGAMPLAWAVCVEAIAYGIRTSAVDFDDVGIPIERWVADPIGSLIMRRRMALWGEKSYSAALALDYRRRSLLRAIRKRVKERWRGKPVIWRWFMTLDDKLELSMVMVPEAIRDRAMRLPMPTVQYAAAHPPAAAGPSMNRAPAGGRSGRDPHPSNAGDPRAIHASDPPAPAAEPIPSVISELPGDGQIPALDRTGNDAVDVIRAYYAWRDGRYVHNGERSARRAGKAYGIDYRRITRLAESIAARKVSEPALV